LIADALSGKFRCVALFELFRGGTGSVELGHLLEPERTDAPRLVALRRLANFPTRELQNAASRAQRLTHPRLAKVLGTYQCDDAWYIASEYVSGVTLYELGQTAVRQRTPVAAPVAVRLVLDALLLTAEAERLFSETAGARCLYPESLWISDSGELFLSELLIAPVLARTTTGASYVAVSEGMSSAALDVRAAAVELARLACGRLMNGNPASWQTSELPAELSGLLARAVAGKPGTDTPAAFANALSTLDPQWIAARDEVRTELERLMGPLRSRRREQLERLQAEPVGGYPAPVFGAARVPKLPDFTKALQSTRPVDPDVLRRAGASTVPPPTSAGASTVPPPRSAGASTVSPLRSTGSCTVPPPGSAPARSRPTNPTPTLPAPPLTPAPAVDPGDSPISGVWREAHAKMGVPGRRVRPKASANDAEPTPPAAVPVPLGVPPARAPKRSRSLLLMALVAVAVGALVTAAWLGRAGSVGPAGVEQREP